MDVRTVLADSPLADGPQYGDPEVCVAILDGPVDLEHPCFNGANVTRLDTLAAAPSHAGPASAHGTHVASVIFGQPDSPVVGLAPRCRGLIAPIFRDAERFVSQIDLARAIEQAVQAGAHVINISGGEPSPDGQPDGTLRRALQLCEDNDVLVVAAVGNDGCSCLQVPAAVPSVLGAGALGADGEPLQTSNWGQAYQSNAILAPGENITGAAPGGGTASLTGSSFAAPLVSGVAALLLSAQVQQGRAIDPRAAGQALLGTALPCQPPDSPECRRYLVGVLNVPGAYASVTKEGRTLVASDDSTEAPHPAEQSLTSETGAVRPETAAGIAPAGDCGCGGGTKGCGCGGGRTPKSYVFSIGEIGFDFGTEARRDSFRQLMPRWPAGGGRRGNGAERPAPGDARDVEAGGEGGGEGGGQGSSAPTVTMPPNPYDPLQLVDYLEMNKADSTKLIWTLNLDLTPIYAVEAEPAYAEEVYKVLRSALRNQSLPSTDPGYVSRVSVPGVLTGRTRRLFSGQVVPVVVAQARGLYTWNEAQLVQEIVAAVGGEFATQQVQQQVRNYLDKIYYQLRNLGQSSPDRALNYAATNAFIFAEGVAQGMTSSTNLPGGQNLYTLDTISVSKSPYCRVDSDCWDVQVTFFDPENDRRARSVYLYTIDVSDEMPVSLAPTHQFYIAS